MVSLPYSYRSTFLWAKGEVNKLYEKKEKSGVEGILSRYCTWVLQIFFTNTMCSKKLCYLHSPASSPLATFWLENGSRQSGGRQNTENIFQHTLPKVNFSLGGESQLKHVILFNRIMRVFRVGGVRGVRKYLFKKKTLFVLTKGGYSQVFFYVLRSYL